MKNNLKNKKTLYIVYDVPACKGGSEIEKIEISDMSEEYERGFTKYADYFSRLENDFENSRFKYFDNFLVSRVSSTEIISIVENYFTSRNYNYGDYYARINVKAFFYKSSAIKELKKRIKRKKRNY